ncbi:hypothetical protein LTR37_007318 [Vermiconidia calcicola]|uniref:Uncharacterized protein n=1 Tax=Vermiconidia calcicola TaxID=1690605 RepID=A0ACC3NE78_9PEZI|nr:hypothetical protein LTR37_007318 [Vermiconidia calcicola]
MIHLATVIPAGLLMVWQFVPIIRRKFILFHRINGYIVSTLIFVGTIGGLMITRRSFGGTPATQTAVGLLGILVFGSLGMAIYNIKRLQIDQHRAWMLRMTMYCGTIINMRVIMIITAQILPLTGEYYTTFSCDELASLMGPEESRAAYPQCGLPNGTTNGYVAVGPGDFETDISTITTALQLGFSAALWLGLFIHVIGVEIYLMLTPAESERLRIVSYEKQLAAGYKNPGSAGLVVERWGDAAPWQPPQLRAENKG